MIKFDIIYMSNLKTGVKHINIFYLFLVGVGGALGAITRYGLNQLLLNQYGSSLLPTFLANISGSFFLGLLTGLLYTHESWPLEIRLFLSVGLLGSFTTFSTLSVATIQLLQSGDFYNAGLNIGLSIIIGLTAATLGIIIGRAI